jgi:N-methylhydantoinase B
VLYVADGTINPAAGARGGLPGAPVKIFQRNRNGEVTPQSAYGDVELQPGETVISVSSGGGGYGPAAERDFRRVRHDLDEGWITRERAESVYGVVFSASGEVDQKATAAKRKELSGAAQA